jgi:hypothetical protein
VLAPTAGAQEVVPPGNSAATQYTEAYPGAGGDTPTNQKGAGQSPAQALGGRNAHRLEAKGPEGQAAAAAAAATTPSTAAGVASGGTGGVGGEAGPSGAGGPGGKSRAGQEGGNAAGSSGSSGLGEVIGQATGSTSSGDMGLLLPLIIVATVLLSAAYAVYAWRRRRSAAD